MIGRLLWYLWYNFRMSTSENDIQAFAEFYRSLDGNLSLEEALRRYREQTASGHSGPPPATALEMLNKNGLAGSIKDAPPDVSTNPIHMEGFGTSGNTSRSA